ncbi:MAG: hypothetical protein HRT57_00470 [Crocinitomicaceae bacterium]|nr:hypothetical protein [Crocinitomicaceae bacterium]
MRVFRITFILGVIGLFVSCKQDKIIPIPEECPEPISFAQDLEPLFVTTCSTSGCHDVSATSGFNLIGYDNIVANADSLLLVIRHVGGTPMPFNGTKWSDENIQKFQCWIQQGSLDN